MYICFLQQSYGIPIPPMLNQQQQQQQHQYAMQPVNQNVNLFEIYFSDFIKIRYEQN